MSIIPDAGVAEQLDDLGPDRRDSSGLGSWRRHDSGLPIASGVPQRRLSRALGSTSSSVKQSKAPFRLAYLSQCRADSPVRAPATASALARSTRLMTGCSALAVGLPRAAGRPDIRPMGGTPAGRTRLPRHDQGAA